jgi:hypothetical protein
MHTVNIYAEEYIQLSEDPVVRMVSEDLAGQPVQITVHRRQVPCTLAVITWGLPEPDAG